MWLGSHPRSGNQSTIWARLLLAAVALFAVLAARNALPDFREASSVHSAFNAVSHHDQRPRFDRDGPTWGAPDSSVLPIPPAVESAHVGPAPRPFSTLQPKGFHYNRPPPLAS